MIEGERQNGRFKERALNWGQRRKWNEKNSEKIKMSKKQLIKVSLRWQECKKVNPDGEKSQQTMNEII